VGDSGATPTVIRSVAPQDLAWINFETGVDAALAARNASGAASAGDRPPDGSALALASPEMPAPAVSAEVPPDTPATVLDEVVWSPPSSSVEAGQAAEVPPVATDAALLVARQAAATDGEATANTDRTFWPLVGVFLGLPSLWQDSRTEDARRRAGLGEREE